ncbi:MAG: acyl-CoA dehydrogenase family protein [Proteobacteria bacterium]|jgi:acyl-CoA dehydrogenase|nr:acyl-CoA dehydrogenase family protein [Pseudomonadota bacterium]MDA1301517.1 acyl-CoA dehydrogenase family protein [Pseudomonadota bacterium]
MQTLNDFRREIRDWLQDNCPAGARGPGQVPNGGHKVPIRDDDTRDWLHRCARKGYTVPMWPTSYGGAGLSMDQYLILLEEMRAINARSPLGGMGVGLIGPTLLEYGTDGQKARHLPRIASGEVRWCQGYSEPNAGSDLASLQTRAVADGDRYVINGQKIWTSGADHADWMFCLVRTDPNAPKHEGISLLLLDMDQPGVTVRPIQLISGASFFCETFFDDAVARRDDLVGEQGRGWTIGKRLLQHERSGITILAGGAAAREPEANPFQRLLAEYCPRGDMDLRRRAIDYDMRHRAYRLTQRRTVAESEDGQTPGPQTSIFELCAANLEKEEADVKSRIIGMSGLGWEGEGFSAMEIHIMREWLSVKRRSIARGSNEIQMNIIAKRVLGLPD